MRTVRNARRAPIAVIGRGLAVLALLIAAGGPSPVARAQEQSGADPHAGHRMVPATPPGSSADAAGQDQTEMDMGAMQGGSAPPEARDPHAYSDGYDFGPLPMLHMAETHSATSLLVNRAEAVRSDGSTATAYDLQAWHGRIYDRAVLKAEGEYDGGEFTHARTELLWGHAVAAYWDTQLGVRYDSGEGPNRGWLAFGVQGLAPYWFETDISAYFGEGGRSALRIETDYELLLTQRLILQPRIEVNAYGKNDTRRALGSGLSGMSAGLRLRYEIRREFAPYVGVEWAGTFGDTRDLVRANGEDAHETRLVAGLRFWF